MTATLMQAYASVMKYWLEKLMSCLLSLRAPEADQYQVIDTKFTPKLAQHPVSFVVLEYHLPVLKKKDVAKLDDTPELITTAKLSN
ncbi:hypothetical protein ACWU4D_18040 [Vibrio sp. WJH972]